MLHWIRETLFPIEVIVKEVIVERVNTIVVPTVDSSLIPSTPQGWMIVGILVILVVLVVIPKTTETAKELKHKFQSKKKEKKEE